MGPELAPRSGELTAKIEVVENLAIEDELKSAVTACHRLMTPCDVKDAQSAHPHPKITIDEIPVVVGAAVADDVTLGPGCVRSDRSPAPPIPARNATHSPALK
jgi:hypothetical protein